jgi:hypothetical protein
LGIPDFSFQFYSHYWIDACLFAAGDIQSAAVCFIVNSVLAASYFGCTADGNGKLC